LDAVIDEKSKSLLAEAVRESADDPAFFCRFFFPHWFPSEMPPFHLGIIALRTRKIEWLSKPEYADALPFLLNEFKYAADPNDTTSTQLPVFLMGEDGHLIMVCDDYLNVMVPRGFSKTTLMNALNLYDIITDGKTFCVYISKSADHAEMQLGNIKVELETNELLRAAYGNQVPTRADAEKWQADQLQLTTGAILVARGKGGQVRGLNYRARRPNRIVLDDVEDDGQADSPTERQKNRKWFYSSVEKAGQLMEGGRDEAWAQQPLQIMSLGTLLHPDALMMTLAKDPKFNTVKFGAKLHLEDVHDTAMLWPYKMSYEHYMKERRRHTIIGQLAEFTREIDSAIRVGDDTLFPTRFIYSPTTRADLAQVALFCDPAISDSPDADDAAIVVAGRRSSDGVLFALDEWGGRGKTPREIVDAMFEYHKKWQCTQAGIESQAYQKALIFMMNEEMAAKGYWFIVKGIVRGSKENKDRRVLGLLSPRYMNGRIHHLRPLPGIESNIADWPNGKKDFADAFASALTMLGESGAMVIPEAERNKGEYAPLPNALPPAFHTVTGLIVKGSRLANAATRYPAGGS
jgi:hypothetical protein